VQYVQQQLYVYKLIGKQRSVLIIERSAQFQGTRGRIDLIVCRQ
jgi:hypothetical protein